MRHHFAATEAFKPTEGDPLRSAAHFTREGLLPLGVASGNRNDEPRRDARIDLYEHHDEEYLMAAATKNAKQIEQMLDRLGKTSRNLTRASERQARQLDVRIKEFVDRGASATDRVLRAIDREIQRDIAGMKRELKRLEQEAERVREAAKQSARKPTASKKRPTKKTAKRKPAAKKAKKVTKRPAVKRVPSRSKRTRAA
jgi:hypothetical protein